MRAAQHGNSKISSKCCKPDKGSSIQARGSRTRERRTRTHKERQDTAKLMVKAKKPLQRGGVGVGWEIAVVWISFLHFFSLLRRREYMQLGKVVVGVDPKPSAVSSEFFHFL